MAKVKDVSANAWLLSIVAAVISISLTANVRSLAASRESDQLEYRRGFQVVDKALEKEAAAREKLAAEFNRTIAILDDWRRDVDRHRTLADEALRKLEKEN